MVIVLPSEQLQPGESRALSAGSVAPFQDHTGEQLQQLGQGVQVAGSGLGRAQDAVADQVSVARAKEGDSLAADGIRGVLQDPEKGYLNTVGKAAVDGRKAAIEAVEEQLRKAEAATQGDERARDAFSRSAEARRQQALARIDAHASQGAKVYAIGQSEARARTFANDAVDLLDDPAAFGARVDLMLDEVRQLSELAGHGPDQVRAAELQATSAVHAAAVERLLTQDRAPDARAHLERAAEEVDAPTRTRLLGMVQREGVNAEGRKLAADVFTKARMAAHDWTSSAPQREDFDAIEAAAIAAIEAQGLPAAVADNAIERVVKLAARERTQQAEADNRILDEAKRFLLENPLSTWRDLPPSLQQSLDEARQLPTIAAFQKAGLQHLTDWDAVARFKATTDEVLREKEPEVLLRELRPVMDDQELKEAMARHAQLRGKADAKQLKIVSDADRVEDWLRENSALPWDGKVSGEQREHAAYVRKKLQRMIQAENVTSSEQLDALLAREEKNQLSVGGVGRPSLALSKAEDAEAGMEVGGEFVRLVQVPEAFQTGLRELASGAKKQMSDARVIAYWVRAGKPKTPQEVNDFLRKGVAPMSFDQVPLGLQPGNPAARVYTWQEEESRIRARAYLDVIK